MESKGCRIEGSNSLRMLLSGIVGLCFGMIGPVLHGGEEAAPPFDSHRVPCGRRIDVGGIPRLFVGIFFGTETGSTCANGGRGTTFTNGRSTSIDLRTGCSRRESP